MTEVLDSTPARRGPLLSLVLLVVLLGLASWRLRAGGDEEARPAPSASPSATPSERPVEYLVLEPGFSTGISPGEYSYDAVVRNAWSFPVTLLAVVPVAASGAAVPAVVRLVPGDEPIVFGSPTPTPARGRVTVAPNGKVTFTVRVTVDCGLPVPVTAIRFTFLADGETREHLLAPSDSNLDLPRLTDRACDLA